MAYIYVPDTTIGLLSVGDMGAGIARLLVAHGYDVASNCTGRSQDTLDRAQDAGVKLLDSDVDLVRQCSIILSVVPPRDAEATARRVIDALIESKREDELYFIDLNAVAPSTCNKIAAAFGEAKVPVRFIDASILGAPPRLKSSSEASGNVVAAQDAHPEWERPRIPMAGPDSLSSLYFGDHFVSTLNLVPISPTIGAASGLKMCFAAMAKGFTAIATQSFTTAQGLGIGDAFRNELALGLPTHLALAEKGVPGMPPKAYRWVREMEEIASTMSEEGGWSPGMFLGAADIYKAVAEDEVMGAEKIGKRQRGTTLEDVAVVMAGGLDKKNKDKSKMT